MLLFWLSVKRKGFGFRVLLCSAATLGQISNQSMFAVFGLLFCLVPLHRESECACVNVSKLQVTHLPATYGRPLIWRRRGRVIVPGCD